MNLLVVNPTLEMLAFIWRPCPFCDRQHAPAVDCLTARFICVTCGAPVVRFNDYWLPGNADSLYCDSCTTKILVQLKSYIFSHFYKV